MTKKKTKTVWIRNKHDRAVSDGVYMIAAGAIIEVDVPSSLVLLGCGHFEEITGNPDDPNCDNPDHVEPEPIVDDV